MIISSSQQRTILIGHAGIETRHQEELDPEETIQQAQMVCYSF